MTAVPPKPPVSTPPLPPTSNPSPASAPTCSGTATVKEKLVDQEAEEMCKPNPGRDQILTRLWELASLSPEVTRGSISGQVKAVSLIVAIEGLIPDRRASASKTQPTAPPIEAETYKAAWLRKQQDPSTNEQPAKTVAATETEPATQGPRPRASSPFSSAQQNRPNPANSVVFPKELSWVPDTAS